MKNEINYYYDLKVDKIVYRDNKYYFSIDSMNYILKELLNNVYLDEFIIKQLDNYDYFLRIQKNINNNYVTIINQKKYVLLKQNNYLNYKLCLNDIKTEYYLSPIDININKFHWITLWENKIDTFEKLMNSKKEQFLSFLSIFNYYIGIGETAILYLKKSISHVKDANSRFVASHRRIDVTMTLYDYYDPTSIIVDYPSRDISEYVKSSIINGTFDINEFDNYLSKIKFQKSELQLLFSRLMFPTFFFDYIEKGKNIDKNTLKKNIENYQKELGNINILLADKYDIEIVKWICKK